MTKLVMAPALLAGCVLVSMAADPADSPHAQSAPLAMEANRIVDRESSLSIALPVGWTLKDGSASGDLTIEHQASRSSFWVVVTPTIADVETEFKGLRLALPFVGGKWQRVSAGWRTIGRRKAGECISTRTYRGSEPLRQWNLVAVYSSRKYLFQGDVPQSQVDSRWSDLEAIVDSIKWLKQQSGSP